MKRIALLFLLGALQWLGATVASAQTGNIAGTVSDKKTKETLIGVQVIARGTAFGVVTDIDGKFLLRGLRPGGYNIEFSYLGYERKLYTNIMVKENETTVLNIELAEEVLSAGEEVVIVGERPIFDVEKSNSSNTVSRADIQAAPVRKIEDVVGLQAGVVKDPTGLFIRGGRAYETGFVVDGVSAQDPLSGTGFGLDLGANSFQSVEVTTGGVGAEYGDVTSGMVAVQTQEGGDRYAGFFSHKRDNPGGLTSNPWNFNTDIYELNFGGPEIITRDLLPALGIKLPGTITFFATGQVMMTDEFMRNTASQVRTSLLESDFWSPRQDNRWNGMLKLTWKLNPQIKIQASYKRSLTVNQNRNMLFITGDDVQVRPGYQFFFAENLDNANTYASSTNLSYIKLQHTLDTRSFYDVQLSRLFTRLRADANGRNWRPTEVDGEFDAESIVTFPVREFDLDTGDFRYILPGPGFANNGGLAPLWHDHFAEEITLRSTYTRYYGERTSKLNIGVEMKFQDYQWIDIVRPWVGAPIQIGPNEFSSSQRLGESSDIWRVRPARGALFVSNQIRYKGLIANLGSRLEYWFPGAYVDDAIENPDAPIPQEIRDAYKRDTYSFFGNRYKLRLLPKLSVSFPVRENQVLFFNYGHSSRVPHPTFVYAGLDPFYQNRSFLANLGNPNLNPEVDISYEMGLRNQLTPNDALNVSVFWRDKYDFITTQSIIIPDATGRETERAFRVNGDYARSRGVEASYFKRHKDWLQGTFSITYSRAEGLSSSNNEALQNLLVGGQAIGNNIETPLAWDRPWDIKGSLTFTRARKNDPLFGVDALNNMKLFLFANYRSGVRYTPMLLRGRQNNPITGAEDWRPVYERDPDPSRRFANVGDSWFWVDINFQKWFDVKGNRMTVFVEITNALNNKNPIIVNPVTGTAYRTDYPTQTQDLIALRNNRKYDVPSTVRDPRFQDPRDNGLPAYLNPANFLAQRQIMLGASINF